jgi:hypothetical protein
VKKQSLGGGGDAVTLEARTVLFPRAQHHPWGLRGGMKS